MTQKMFRISPLPYKDGEVCVVDISEEGADWRTLPTPFPSREEAEKFVDEMIKGFEILEAYQVKNPPYLYPKRLLN